MKSTNEIEIIGFGKYKTYNIKVEETEFQQVNKELKPIKKVLVSKGTQGTYKFIDEAGKEYPKQEIGFNVMGNFLQKVERTKTIKKFNLVDKIAIANDILNLKIGTENVYLLYGDTTSNMALSEKLGDNMALELPSFKGSSIGMKWRKAYITKINNFYMLILLKKIPIEQAQEQFKAQLTAVAQLKDLSDEIKVIAKAEDLEIII